MDKLRDNCVKKYVHFLWVDSVFEKTIRTDRNIRLIVEDVEESINVQK